MKCIQLLNVLNCLCLNKHCTYYFMAFSTLYLFIRGSIQCPTGANVRVLKKTHANSQNTSNLRKHIRQFDNIYAAFRKRAANTKTLQIQKHWSDSCIISSCLCCGFLTSAAALLCACTGSDHCKRESVLFVTPWVPQNPSSGHPHPQQWRLSHYNAWPIVGYTSGYLCFNNAYVIIMQAPQKSLKWQIQFNVFWSPPD